MNWKADILISLICQILVYLIGTTLGNRCGDVLAPEIHGDQVLIRYIPGPETNFNVHNYNKNCGFRWLWETDHSQNIVDLNMDKYRLQNLSLIINDVTSSDAMTYYVQCDLINQAGTCSAVITDKVVVSSELVNQYVSTSPVTTLTSQESVEEAPFLSIKATSTIVASVCVVLIVAIVSGTILAVLKHKKKKQDGTTNLVGSEIISSSALAGHGSESIYNEIDIKAQIPDSKLTTQNSPMLPARPENRIKINTTSGSEYATIDESEMIDGTIQNGNIVQKCIDDDGDSRANYCQFIVKFPEINCETLTQKLNQNCEESSQKIVYSTVSKGPVRRKSRVKSSELKYITIDHTADPLCWHGNHEEPDRSQLTKEYASIDFDKKAFVAPIRKAPSSWYKRKRRKR